MSALDFWIGFAYGLVAGFFVGGAFWLWVIGLPGDKGSGLSGHKVGEEQG